jgi:hypothetical protein
MCDGFATAAVLIDQSMTLFPGLSGKSATSLRARVARLAVCAVVLNAWAPTVTALLAYSAGRTVAMPEHCLAMATEAAQDAAGVANDGKGTERQQEKDRGASCPFCFAHAGTFGLAPLVHVPEIQELGRYRHASLFAPAAQAHLTWLNARPRGPPATPV